MKKSGARNPLPSITQSLATIRNTHNIVLGNSVFLMKKISLRRTLLIMSLSALIFNTGCESKMEKEEEINFLVTSPLKSDTSIIKGYVCQIRSIQHIELRAMERGYLQEIFVDEGQFVKEGQLMFKIMPLIYQAELEKSQAEANFTEIEYLNTKALSDSNIVSKNELALAKAKLDKAKAELALARVHLGFTEIRAPFDGIMDHFHVRLGSLIDEGDLLTTLSDNSKMWVYFNVPEAEYLNYKTHEKKDSLIKVKLLMANNQLFEHSGVIQTIEADFDNETGNIDFRATFPNPVGLLRHGETGNIEMTMPFKNALMIPQKATFEVLEKKYVFVVDQKNVVHQKEITIIGEMPDLYVISKGVGENEKILFEGLRKVSDGDEISCKYENPKMIFPKLRVTAE